MAESDKSRLSNGGDEMGMSDMQFKTYLLTQLDKWQEIRELAIKAGNTDIQAKAEKQITDINHSLKF